MTNHSYFNLSGNPSKAATDHILYVNADNYTPVDSTFMTTGEIVTVKDTPMDFTTPKTIGQDITNFDFVQLKNGNGYDHNWVLNTNGDIAQLAAKLTSPESGITLEVYTNEPGIQVYTGNFLDGTVTGKKALLIINVLPYAWKHNTIPTVLISRNGLAWYWSRDKHTTANVFSNSQ